MNEATFPGGPGLACSDAFQQTGRMEACGRLEGWKHHVHQADSTPPDLDSHNPSSLPLSACRCARGGAKSVLLAETGFQTPGQLEQKHASAIFMPLPGMLLVSLCHSGRAHGNRAPFLRGRRASSATLDNVPVLDGGGNGMRPVQRCGPCGSSSVQPPAHASHPPSPASPVSHLFAVCSKFWFSFVFRRKRKKASAAINRIPSRRALQTATGVFSLSPLTGCKDRRARNVISRRFPSRLSAQHSACVWLRPRLLPESQRKPTVSCPHPAARSQPARQKPEGRMNLLNCRDSLGAGIPALKTRD